MEDLISWVLFVVVMGAWVVAPVIGIARAIPPVHHYDHKHGHTHKH